MEKERFKKAKDYGEQSLEAADEAEDRVWQLNASVLIAQAEGMFTVNSLIKDASLSMDIALIFK